MSTVISPAQARAIWMSRQGLDGAAPFGFGPEAARGALARLGYVQIDTISVIERCHHHILWSRIPDYRPQMLAAAQSRDKTVFEYWTHALAYLPVEDFRFFRARMKQWRTRPKAWFGALDPREVRALIRRIKDHGPLSIRDIDEGPRLEKDHPWASRKPAKRALEWAFFCGDLTVSARTGMLKTYDLTARHFGWDKPPRAATPNEIDAYRLDRALRAQGIVSLSSVCYLDAARKASILDLIERRVRRGHLLPVHFEGAEAQHWAAPESLDMAPREPLPLAHLLSPFDPLVIQRKRLARFFGYEHRFEAYVPPDKRVLGYFALPVLFGDRIVAALDIKADRKAKRLLIQRRTEFAPLDGASRAALDASLERFARFQFGTPEPAGER